MKPLTKAQRELLEDMRALADNDDSGWEAVPSDYAAVIRWSETVDTPEHMRGKGWGHWDSPTYDRLVFITLTHSGVILGVASAPWVNRSDWHIPYWLANAILGDPRLALNTERRLALIEERKHQLRGQR